MLPGRPLVIRVDEAAGPAVRVANTNNVQRKIRTVDLYRSGRAELMGKYSALGREPVRVREQDEMCCVTLPLVLTTANADR